MATPRLGRVGLARLRFTPHTPSLLYADASSVGRIGCVIIYDGRKYCTCPVRRDGSPPDRVFATWKHTRVFGLRISATLEAACPAFPRCDSKGGCGAGVRDLRAAATGRNSTSILAFPAIRGIDVRGEYVSSGRNRAYRSFAIRPCVENPTGPRHPPTTHTHRPSRPHHPIRPLSAHDIRDRPIWRSCRIAGISDDWAPPPPVLSSPAAFSRPR